MKPIPRLPYSPKTPLGRARVRSLCQIIGVDIHPINNLRVLRYLESMYGESADGKKKWFHEWAHTGMAALEARLTSEPQTGRFCHGGSPGMADICLYAQMFNNIRFGMDMSAYPTIMRIHGECDKLPAFQAGAPKNQPDAP